MDFASSIEYNAQVVACGALVCVSFRVRAGALSSYVRAATREISVLEN